MFSAQNSQASSDVNYIEDVFSTWLYTGTGSSLTITNNINLSGKGGLVWGKRRVGTSAHNLYDTSRGATNSLTTNGTAGQTATAQGLASFNNNGFTLGTDATLNNASASNVAWTFREQSKFFDIVTYTGTGVARTVAHNLGSVPGSMIIKRTDTSGNAWYVYHRSLGATKVIYLNQTDVAATVTSPWNDTEPTSTEFTVGANNNNNASGGTFVAYLFAHNAGGFGLFGTDNVISCGTYNGNSTTNSINLGYEPQWLLIKRTTVAVSSWILLDNMRGLTVGTSDAALSPNTSDAEGVTASVSGAIRPTATGFDLLNSNSALNVTGSSYIYIAIRRPMKVPTLGTSVFSVDTTTADSAITSTLKQSDMGWFKDRTTVANWFVADRLRGFTSAYYTPTLYTNLTNVEATPTTGDTLTAFGPTTTGVNNGVLYAGGAGIAANYPLLYSFKRAPGFFDEVCYTGTGSVLNVTHNLGAIPELIIIKCRNQGTNWAVYSAPTTALKYLFLNANSTVQSNTPSLWNDTTPTSSVFTLAASTAVDSASTNRVSDTFTAYLFSTVAGVSKVGSYTGTGALQTINCGFTSGARFVLIKRTNSTGDWYVWDSVRGISSGTDPYLLLNSTAAEVTANNYVDTDSTGFKVTAAAPAALNASGGTYIFLAIA